MKATMLGRMVVLTFSLATALTVFTGTVAHAQQAKPSILVIMGDDIGYWNISAYNREGMGYRTPNIDRIANAKLQAIVGQHLQTFREFPSRQKPGSVPVGEAMEMLMKGKGSNYAGVCTTPP